MAGSSRHGPSHDSKGTLVSLPVDSANHYFLQVGWGEQGQLLPSFDYFVTSKRLVQKGLQIQPPLGLRRQQSQQCPWGAFASFRSLLCKEF